MTGRPKVPARDPIKVAALFMLAFALQGTSLFVFQGDREANKREADLRRAASNGPTLIVGQVYTVTTVQDEGPGSLRQAILDANHNPGLDEIVFDFAQPITLTVFDPFEVTDPLMIDAASSIPIDINPITKTITIDASNVGGDLFRIVNAPGSTIRGLRVVNVHGGYGYLLSQDTYGAKLLGNAVENSYGGIRIVGGQNITVTQSTLTGLKDMAINISGTSDVWLLENRIKDAGLTGILLTSGVHNSLVFSNSIEHVQDEFGAGITIGGDPAPTGIVVRHNTFTETSTPVYFGPGVNLDFPAPEIARAYYPLDTLIIVFDIPANPSTYPYPLSVDLYRVRDGNYVPMGVGTTYEATDYPNAITKTLSVGNLLEKDLIAAVATTYNPSTSPFSAPVVLSPPPDSDNDGVIDSSDLCPGTVVPEATVPSEGLRLNRFALVDADLTFDTVLPEGEGPSRTYTTTETGGCSCEQIIDKLGLGGGHTKFGCSISVMDRWVAQVEAAAKDGPAAASSVAATPESFVLEQNYPNPFNPSTTISFALPEQRHVTVRVFDVVGRIVTTLVDTELDQGAYRVTWNGRNAQGQSVASGLYVYRIEAGDFSSSKTMSLLR